MSQVLSVIGILNIVQIILVMLRTIAAAFKTIEHSGKLDGIRVSLEYEMRCETHFRNYNLKFFF